MRDQTSQSPLNAQPHDYFGYAACRTDGTEEHVVYMKDMVESREDFVLLQFPWLEDGKRYDLIYDMGKDGAPVYYERDVDRKYLLDLDDENGTPNDGG